MRSDDRHEVDRMVAEGCPHGDDSPPPAPLKPHQQAILLLLLGGQSFRLNPNRTAGPMFSPVVPVRIEVMHELETLGLVQHKMRGSTTFHLTPAGIERALRAYAEMVEGA